MKVVEIAPILSKQVRTPATAGINFIHSRILVTGINLISYEEIRILATGTNPSKQVGIVATVIPSRILATGMNLILSKQTRIPAATGINSTPSKQIRTPAKFNPFRAIRISITVIPPKQNRTGT